MKQQTNKKRIDAIYNKKIILKSTIDLSNNGVDITQMNMSEIAENAGVGVGTLYRHFKSKATLCEAVMDEQVENMFQDIKVYLETHKEETSYQRIFNILLLFLSLKESNFTILSFIEKSFDQSGSLIRIPFYHKLANTIKAQLELTEIENLDFKINVMFNCFSSDFYYYAKYTQKLSKNEFLKNVLDIIL